MKRTIVTLALVLLGAVSVLGQAKPDADKKPAAPMPTADEVLEKSIKAVGGKEAIMKITSRVEKGMFELPSMGVSTPVEVYAKAPNKAYFFLDVPSYGVVQDGFDGTTAWAQDPQSGLREKTGTELAEVKLDEDFYRAVKLKELYSKRELKGVESVGGREAYVVVLTPTGGSAEKLYFDKENGLLVQRDMERDGGQGRGPVQQFLSDYKEVDGVKVPHTLRIVSGIGEIILKITEIKHNVAVEDSKFSKPAAKP